MSGRPKLEVFGTGGASDMVTIAMSEMEEARAAAYESGYKAGWDDCVTAQQEEEQSLSADLARSLQTLSFTYHEARSHVLAALTPVLTLMVTRLLPEIARESLAATVLERIEALAAEQSEAPVTVQVNPAARAAVETLLQERAAPPCVVEEDPLLDTGQAHLRLGQIETRIDLDRAAAEIRSLVSGFFQSTEERTDG